VDERQTEETAEMSFRCPTCGEWTEHEVHMPFQKKQRSWVKIECPMCKFRWRMTVEIIDG
jgi:transcription elongation factor Elf1